MKYVCGACHRHYTSGKDMQGARCPECGAALRAEPAEPSSALTEPTIAASPRTAPPAPPSHRSAPSSSDHATLVGAGASPKKTFGKYRIECEIARGGMGIVYKVHDPDLRREVALKVLIAGEGATEESILRFIREARSAARLNHPNIVRIYDIGTEGGQHYFTMDFIDGSTLDSLMRGRRSKSHRERMLECVRTVALALADAHAQGIFHRDLKPANIMLDRRGEPILMDFGLAKDATSDSIQSMSGSICGTPAYMSPEQAGGHTSRIDHRTDIYALGVILYEAMTGLLPFAGNSVFDTISKVISDEPPPPRRLAPHMVDADMQTIILKCMEKDPAKRYQTMPEFAEDLRRYLDGEPIAARPVWSVVRVWRRIRRKPLALAACIALPLVAVTSVLLASYFAGPNLLEKAVADMRNPASTTKDRVAVVSTVSRLRERGDLPPRLAEQADALLRECITTPEEAVSLEAMDSAVRRGDALAAEKILLIAQQKERIGNLEPFPPERRVAALERLAPLLPLVQPILMPNLSPGVFDLCEDTDETVDVRRAAIRAAAAIEGAKAGERLLRLATGTGQPVAVRTEAVRAIGRERLTLNSPLLDGILRLCGDPEPAVADAAHAAVSEARTKDSIFAFYGLEPAISKAAGQLADIQALQAGRNRDIESILDGNTPRAAAAPEPWQAVSGRLASTNPDERRAAAQALGTMGDVRAVPSLLKALEDPDAAVRELAIRSLAALYAENPTDPAPARALLDHAAPAPRAATARYLGLIRDAASVLPLVHRVQEDADMEVVSAAAGALAQVGNIGALPPVLRICRTGPTARVGAIEKGLRHHNTPAAILCLMAMLQHNGDAIRAHADGTLRALTGEDFQGDPRKWFAWAATQDAMLGAIRELRALREDAEHPFRSFMNQSPTGERPLAGERLRALREQRPRRAGNP